jgi:heme exporter protein C
MWTFFHKLGSPPWLYRIAGIILRWLLPVAVLGLLVGATWGLLYTAPDFRQGNSYRIIYIHVPAAVVALAGYYVMAIAGADHLIWKMKIADMAMMAAAPVGAALTFIALVTGSIWGKPTWGAWWVWDARITSMLILLFLYLGVIALYEAYDNKAAASRACAVLSLVGTVNIPIIYKSVDWWYSLHQPASIKFTGESTIDPSMLWPLLRVHRVLLCPVHLRAAGQHACRHPQARATHRLGAAPGRGDRLMYFESLSAALAMNGHGAYVWSAYAITAFVLLQLMLAPRRGRRRLLRELRADSAGSRRCARTQTRRSILMACIPFVAAPLGGAEYRAFLQCRGRARGLRAARQHQPVLSARGGGRRRGAAGHADPRRRHGRRWQRSACR